ncbi:MAG: helix-turn-helix domain-containing protein [Candidatus Diapherotrites archaeon]|nr:helix-turn-helix domain-containing protein [Candidatus Diapherotrites archaeon]
MKIAIKSQTDALNLSDKSKDVHLTRPLQATDLEMVLTKVDSLSLSESTFYRLSQDAVMTLETYGRLGKTIDVQKAKAGRAIETNPHDIQEIIELKKEGLTIREIAKELELTKSTVHYLLKYAKRSKIKNGQETLHV